MWREISAEFAALGWHAVLHGPEAHLVLPVIYGLIGAIVLLIGRRKK